MNRNVAHLRLDYDWLQGGKFYNKYDIPFVEKSSLAVLWRGVYDSIYDTTPGFIDKEDIHGRAYSGNLTCPSSGKSGTLVLYEVANGVRTLTGRYVMDWSYGCTRNGRFTAIMPDP